MKYVSIFILVICFIKLNKCFPHDSTVLTSKYAKVAVWGNNKTNSPGIEEERNNKNDRIWNHRLDPKSIGVNTKKKNPSVAYQYPVYQASNKKAYQGVEHVPGIGEVIVAPAAQDRFEARPLFAYRNKQTGTYGAPPAPKPNQPVVTVPTTRSPVAPPPPRSPSLSISSSSSSFSNFNNPPAPPISGSNSNENLYSSPFSSYNPPDFSPDGSSDDSLFPPNAASNEDSNNMNSGAQASSMEDQSAPTEKTKSNTPDSYASLGPPLSSYNIEEDNQPDHGVSSYENNDYQDQRVPHDPMTIYKNNNGPPKFPPKSIDDVYYPPDFPKDQVPHYGDHGNPDDGMKQPQDLMILPPKNKMNGGKATGNGNDLYLAPPPSHDYEHGHNFPQYLYDHHHYDNHVYEEIPHTTMAPAKEDKRVSSTHYSYYYLGRKLWYIPLYFSVYFIIYVTVLILKSIARHKVRLKYKWYEHDISAKEARSMDLDAIRDEEITKIHRNVTVALQKATEKYNSVLAMKK